MPGLPDFNELTSNPELEKQIKLLLKIELGREAKWLKVIVIIVSVSTIIAALFEALSYFRG